MEILTWLLTGFLAAAFLGAGAMKLLTPYASLTENPQMAWSRDFSPGAVKAIAAAEVLAAIGLVLPWVTGIAPVLTPLAAVGLAITMVGAMVVHGRRGEWPALAPNAALLVLALAVAVLRFGQL